MPTSLYIQQKINQITTQYIFYTGLNMEFRFKCCNLPFFGRLDGTVDKCSPFRFFLHAILYLLSQYVQNYRPLPHLHRSIKITFFKVTTYLSCRKDYLSCQMCSNTMKKQVIMNINNQDTFLQHYYARNVILGKSFQ